MFHKLFARRPVLTDPVAVCAAAVEAFRGLPGIVSVEPEGDDPLALKVTAETGSQSVHLANLCAAVLSKGLGRRDQDALIGRFAQSLVDAQTVGTVDPAKLVPALRHHGYYNQGTIDAVTRPMLGDLTLVLMQDGEHAMSTVSPEMLEGVSLTEEEAWATAEANFSALRDRLAVYETDGGVKYLTLDGVEALGNSLLLVADLLHAVRQKEGGGALLLAVPTREEVSFVVEGPGNRERIAADMQDGLSRDHPQSEYLYRLAEGDARPIPVAVLDGGILRDLQ